MAYLVIQGKRNREWMHSFSRKDNCSNLVEDGNNNEDNAEDIELEGIDVSRSDKRKGL